jgi:hypothetical protein
VDGDLESLSWVQVRDEKATTLDLNRATFSLVDRDLKVLPPNSYRVSSKGCLGVPKEQEFILRIPGKTNLFTTLDASNQPLRLLSLQPLEAPLTVSLEPARPVYQGASSVRIRSSEQSSSRYCVEEVAQVRCIKTSDLQATYASPEFLSATESLELPRAEGRYRLYILSETRDGSLSLNPFDFAIDNTAPTIIPDFVERLSAISYFGAPTYFLDAGYPIKFLALNDTLAGTRIEYCLLPAAEPSLVCCLRNGKPFTGATRGFPIDLSSLGYGWQRRVRELASGRSYGAQCMQDFGFPSVFGPKESIELSDFGRRSGP